MSEDVLVVMGRRHGTLIFGSHGITTYVHGYIDGRLAVHFTVDVEYFVAFRCAWCVRQYRLIDGVRNVEIASGHKSGVFVQFVVQS